MSVEPWLRGPVDGVPAALQPAAHALLNALADVEHIVAEGMTDGELRTRPGGAASIGFHLMHLAGAADRLTTYAAGRGLSDAQRADLARESDRATLDALVVAGVLERVRSTVGRVLDLLRDTDPATLTEPCGVGRAALPSTVGGLLFHAAEHTARHAGQALTTFRVVRGLAAVHPAGSSDVQPSPR